MLLACLAFAWIAATAPPLTPAQRAAMSEATRLHEDGRYAEAALRLEEMLVETDGDPEVVYDAAQSRMAAGHHAHAWRHFQAYLATPGLAPDDRALAMKRLGDAEVRTSLVTVRLSPGTGGMLAARRADEPAGDGRPELATPVVGDIAELRLDPGPWELRVAAPGRPPVRRRVEVGAGPMTVELAPAPAPAIAPRNTAPPPRSSARGERIAGAVLMPLGVVALGAMALVAPAYQETRSRSDRVRATLDADPCDVAAQADLRAAIGEAKREQAAMIGLGVTSAALLATGVALVVRGTRAPGRATLQLRPGLTGLILSGRF